MPTEAPLQSIVKGAVDQIARSLNELGTLVSTAISESSDSLVATSTNLVNGVTGVNNTLGLIKNTLAGVLRVDVGYPDAESTVYRGFRGAISGTGTLTVWTPTVGRRFRLKGYAVAGVVSPDSLDTAEAVLLYFQDAATLSVVAPIAAIGEDATAEASVFSGVAPAAATPGVGSPVVVHLGSGRLGSAAGVALRIAADITLGAGDIKVVGCVWGTEE